LNAFDPYIESAWFQQAYLPGFQKLLSNSNYLYRYAERTVGEVASKLGLRPLVDSVWFGDRVVGGGGVFERVSVGVGVFVDPAS
jgi:hypothetical protein